MAPKFDSIFIRRTAWLASQLVLVSLLQACGGGGSQAGSAAATAASTQTAQANAAKIAPTHHHHHEGGSSGTAMTGPPLDFKAEAQMEKLWKT